MGIGLLLEAFGKQLGTGCDTITTKECVPGVSICLHAQLAMCAIWHTLVTFLAFSLSLILGMQKSVSVAGCCDLPMSNGLNENNWSGNQKRPLQATDNKTK